MAHIRDINNIQLQQYNVKSNNSTLSIIIINVTMQHVNFDDKTILLYCKRCYYCIR